MLRGIQQVGTGPPTYIYSQKAVSASNGFFQVFATETTGYDARREKKKDNLRELYEKEYGKRETFLWNHQ